jgi:WhiB family redox-sensing transcriptional regulator
MSVLIVGVVSGTSPLGSRPQVREWPVVNPRQVSGVWQERAACRNYPELSWFRSSDERVHRAAIAVCDGCAVRRECFDYAVEAREPAGIWGGVEFPRSG